MLGPCAAVIKTVKQTSGSAGQSYGDVARAIISKDGLAAGRSFAVFRGTSNGGQRCPNLRP